MRDAFASRVAQRVAQLQLRTEEAEAEQALEELLVIVTVAHGGIPLAWWVARKGPLGFSLQHTTHPHLSDNQVFNLFQAFAQYLEVLDSKKLCHFDVSVGNCCANENLNGGFLIDYSSLAKFGSEIKNPTFTRSFTPYRHLKILLSSGKHTPLIAESGDDLESLLLTMLYVVHPTMKIFQVKEEKILSHRKLFVEHCDSIPQWNEYYQRIIPSKYAKLVPLFAIISFKLFTERNVADAFRIIRATSINGKDLELPE